MKKNKKYPKPLRIDIGGGTQPREGFLSVDLYCESDIRASALDMPFDDSTVDEVYSSHTLEHFSRHEVPRVLAEIFRVMKSGAAFTVEVPDFVYCVREWLKVRNDGFEMDRLFGLQSDPGQEHKIGFTRELLEKYLRGAGFEIESFQYIWSHAQDCFLCVCRKP